MDTNWTTNSQNKGNWQENQALLQAQWGSAVSNAVCEYIKQTTHKIGASAASCWLFIIMLCSCINLLIFFHVAQPCNMSGEMYPEQIRSLHIDVTQGKLSTSVGDSLSHRLY